MADSQKIKLLPTENSYVLPAELKSLLQLGSLFNEGVSTLQLAVLSQLPKALQLTPKALTSPFLNPLAPAAAELEEGLAEV